MGPLKGVRIVEMAGIGPAPFCGMLLADLGADIIRIDRLTPTDLGFAVDSRFDFLNRGKRAVALDLKAPAGVEVVRRLIGSADALIEGFRPGVMERLGLGPEVALAVNPRLVYGRMTGWGQDGPLKHLAGHDINYIALMGVLNAIGPEDGGPVVPLNLIGDFGGGALYLAVGILSALLEARSSGQGQVVDAAMIDGAASLMTMQHGLRQAGIWKNARASNPIDGGAPYYTTYRTRDGRYMAVGAIEERFYRELLDKLGLAGESLPDRDDRSRWDALRSIFAATFETRTRDEWSAVFGNSDACVTPVLDMAEATSHSHVQARKIFARDGDIVEPGPAPRFSRTPASISHAAVDARADTRAALSAWGFSEEQVDTLAASGVIAPG